MALHTRIRMARRYAGLSQAKLAQKLMVHRSAVGHWERENGPNPSTEHLRQMAQVTRVQFEWLATGRGTMQLANKTELESVPAADAMLIEDELEMRLMHAFRHAPPQCHIALVEVVEQLALLRVGRSGRRGDPEKA